MKRKFRLRKSTDFKRVRRLGKSYAHPFVVLVKLPNDREISRFGIAAGRSIGNAVERNRTKRRIREIIRRRICVINGGWDIVILARKPITEANYTELNNALDELILRSKLSKEQNGNRASS